MRSPRRVPMVTGFLLVVLFWPLGALAQAIETAGSRGPGMGGAFVAVATDSSATWWNPAGIAAGPFLDMSLHWNAMRTGGDTAPASRTHISAFSFATPPAGVSYYRFRVTDIVSDGTTATGEGGRQSKGTGVAIRSIPRASSG